MWLMLGGDGFVGTHLGLAFGELGVAFESRGLDDGDFREGVPAAWIESAGAVLLLAGTIRAESEEQLRHDNVAIAEAVARAYGEATARPPLFFLSSLHVYSPTPEPLRFDAHTDPPRNTYGAVKLECEALLSRAAMTGDFPLWIGRAGNLVALEPPINPLSFVADMRASLHDEGTITVRRNPVRDLVLISDLARGLESRREAGLRRGGVISENVCTGRPIPLREVADIAAALHGSGSVNHEPAGGHDVLLGVPPDDRLWGAGPTVDEIATLIAVGDH